MAAPSPYWKRKTRPCPFYQQGRCLFSDACNFVHSVKVNPPAYSSDARVPFDEPTSAEAAPTPWKAPEGNNRDVTTDGYNPEGGGSFDGKDSPARLASLKRSSSSSSRRRSVMSPPRSPRLSGLLSVLEPLIGPDVEEFEEVEEEDEDQPDQERITSERGEFVDSSEIVSSSSRSSPNILDIMEEREDETSAPIPLEEKKLDLANLKAPVQARRPSSARSKVPAPIITHSTRPSSVFYNPISGNTLELRSLRPQSTLDLLASPLLSPLLRIPSPTLLRERGLLSAISPTGPRPYSDDDLESPDPQEISVERSASSNSSSSSDVSYDEDSSKEYSEQSFDLIDTSAEPLDSLEHLSLDPASPQETERPWSDSSRTPPATIRCDSTAANELDGLPPLYPSLLMFEDGVKSGLSRIQVLPDDQDTTSLVADVPPRPSSIQSFIPGRNYLSPISTNHASSSSLNSPSVRSLGPSPVSTDMNSSYTSDTLIEPDPEDEWAETKIVSTKDFSTPSPTKVIRESFLQDQESNQKTVRAAPSPLRDDSLPSESSLSPVASSAVSWDDISNRSSAMNRVSFGFRQSSKFGRSRSSRQSIESHLQSASSTSSASPSTTYSESIPESQSTRARSASPALPNTSRDIDLRANSDPPTASPSAHVLPRSASQIEFVPDRTRSESPLSIIGSDSSSRRPSWMRPLRLSQLVHSPIYSSHNSPHSASLVQKRYSTAFSPSSASHIHNSSQGSSVNNTLRYSARSSLISAYLNDSATPAHDTAHSFSSSFSQVSLSAHNQHGSVSTTRSGNTAGLDLLSPLSGSMRGFEFNELSRWRWPGSGNNDQGFRDPLIPGQTRPYSVAPPISSFDTPQAQRQVTPTSATMPAHAIATPRPTLLFAIASDNPKEVERVLSGGEARPDDDVGPQSALEFALTNDELVHKTEIVKLLLAYGANPNALPQDLRNAHAQHAGETAISHDEAEEQEDVLSELPFEGSFSRKRRKRESALNPAMKYYLNRAAGSLSSAALRRTDFRSLGRMRFDFVGQDRALEHLYWVLSMHSQQPIGTPLVVLCCGPSGHGKSLLARKFGSLLDVPTHTVNMTILKTSHDLWQCPSMSPYDQPSQRTLAEFLSDNEGKRCVVVLDEIDKNEDERTLWSLLAPWELGRCSIDAGRRHIDVRNVIWLGTSNIGQDLIFEHHDARLDANIVISKAEYRELMNLLRPRVTERLGTSLMSRVTAVLPFVPFIDEEKLAIASEAILALGDERASELAPDEFERLAGQCVAEYVHSEGARSLYRSVSTHLMELF